MKGGREGRKEGRREEAMQILIFVLFADLGGGVGVG